MLIITIGLIILSIYRGKINYETLLIAVSVVCLVSTMLVNIHGLIIVKILNMIYMGYALYEIYYSSNERLVKIVCIGILAILIVIALVSMLGDIAMFVEGSYGEDAKSMRFIKYTVGIKGDLDIENTIYWILYMVVLLIFWAVALGVRLFNVDIRVDYIMIPMTLLTLDVAYILVKITVYLESVVICVVALITSIVYKELYMDMVMASTTLYVISSYIKNYKIYCYIEDGRIGKLWG